MEKKSSNRYIIWIKKAIKERNSSNVEIRDFLDNNLLLSFSLIIVLFYCKLALRLEQFSK